MTHSVKRINTCSFSGYRPEKLPWGARESDPRCAELKLKLYRSAEALLDRGLRHFICGMARGSDMFFAEAVLRLREQFPAVTLEAALPCEEQAARWPEEARRRYFDLVSRCDFETLVSRGYTRDCMALRNRYMVDNASVLIAVYDGRFGGTMHTVGYARKQGLEVIEIKP